MGFLIVACLFMHVIGDYVLQTSFMANAKQKIYWEKQFKEMQIDGRNYKYDYVVILIMHSIVWTVCIMLPIVIYYWLQTWQFPTCCASIFIMNVIWHSIIDNCKANQMSINLIEDQIFHMLQIAISIVILLTLN